MRFGPPPARIPPHTGQGGGSRRCIPARRRPFAPAIWTSSGKRRSEDWPYTGRLARNTQMSSPLWSAEGRRPSHAGRTSVGHPTERRVKGLRPVLDGTTSWRAMRQLIGAVGAGRPCNGRGHKDGERATRAVVVRARWRDLPAVRAPRWPRFAGWGKHRPALLFGVDGNADQARLMMNVTTSRPQCREKPSQRVGPGPADRGRGTKGSWWPAAPAGSRTVGEVRRSERARRGGPGCKRGPGNVAGWLPGRGTAVRNPANRPAEQHTGCHGDPCDGVSRLAPRRFFRTQPDDFGADRVDLGVCSSHSLCLWCRTPGCAVTSGSEGRRAWAVVA